MSTQPTRRPRSAREFAQIIGAKNAREFATALGATPVTVVPAPVGTAVSAPYAPAAGLLSGTSETTNTIGAPPATVSFTMDQFGISFSAGMRVRAAVATAPTSWMEGAVVSYIEPVLTITTDLMNGPGTYSSWNIATAGQPGQAGTPGPIGPTGPAGGIVEAPTDNTNYARKNSLWNNVDAVFAPIVNAHLSGVPTAPTPVTADSSTTLATTAYVKASLTAAGAGMPEAPTDGGLYARQNSLWIDTNPLFAAKAPLASPALTGTPTAPTAAANDNTTKIATTAWVTAQIALLAAPLASPVFTGDPHAPTPAPGDNDTSIATTAFVTASFAPIASPTFTGTPSAPTPISPADNTTKIATTAFVQANISPLAPKASPALTGVPTAPTPTAGDNSTALATTAFVTASFATTASVAATYAPKASPALTGTPTAPTPLTADSSTTLATTAFVHAAVTAAGGIADAPNDGHTYSRKSAAWFGIDTVYAPLASPTFTGTPAAPTPLTADSSTTVATTAFVHAVSTADNAAYAPLASPALTGTPTAPTVLPGSDSTTKIATTAFVQAAIAAIGGGLTDAPADSHTYARRNNVWLGIDTVYAPLASLNTWTAQQTFSSGINVNGASAYNVTTAAVIGDGVNSFNSITTTGTAGFAGSGLINLQTLHFNAGGAGGTGGFNTLNCVLNLFQPTANTSAANYVSGTFVAQGTVADTATSSLWGINPNARLTTAATGWLQLIGSEIDVACWTGCSVQDIIGEQIVQTFQGVVAGTRSNIAYSLNNQTGAAGWDVGFCFGSYSGNNPIASAGTLIGTQQHGVSKGYGIAGSMGTVAYGLDISGYTFSGAPVVAQLRTPTSGSAAGKIGSVCWDAGFIYVCTATNTWKSAALAAFGTAGPPPTPTYSNSVFTTPGAATYTTPPDTTTATVYKVRMVAGGGGGGGYAASASNFAGAGGAGEYCEGILSGLAASTAVTLNVGAAGTAGGTAGGNGTPGGNTTLAVGAISLSLIGGKQGTGSSGATAGTSGLGGRGGLTASVTGWTLLLDVPGQAGSPVILGSSTAQGGNSLLGLGGIAGSSTANAGPGFGGGGANPTATGTTASAGQPGGVGCIIIERIAG